MNEIKYTPPPDMLQYDVETMKSLVGTNIEYCKNTYKVIDYIHHHLFLVRERDNYSTMVECQYIQQDIDKTKATKQLVASNPIEKIFNNRGYENEWSAMDGPSYTVWGILGGFSETGVMKDTRQIIDRYHEYDRNYAIGIQIQGYSYAHTLREDKTKKCGYYMQESDREIKLDDLDWIPYDQLSTHAFNSVKKNFNKYIRLKNDICYKNASTEGKTMIYFFDFDGDTVYRFSGPFKEEQWGKEWYCIEFGTKVSSKVAKVSSSRDKFNIPQDTILKPWEEIKEEIFGYLKPLFDKLFAYTPQEKAEHYYKPNKTNK